MSTLSHHRGGAGEPLLLLHGIGSHWQVWRPVLDRLEAEREVVAVDLPGFGASAPLPGGVEASPQALADAVAAFLDGLGWETAHVAGNSLGGWIALELAKRGRTRSVCALSPAGFWRGWESTYARLSLRNARAAGKLLLPRTERLYQHAGARKAAFGQMAVHGDRIAPAEAVAATRDLVLAPGWERTLEAMRTRSFEHPDAVRGPVTIAWGAKDRLLLPRQATRARAVLPRARHLLLPDAGHVPTWDAPDVVAQAVLTS